MLRARYERVAKFAIDGQPPSGEKGVTSSRVLRPIDCGVGGSGGRTSVLGLLLASTPAVTPPPPPSG
jgi:hypothetical protein